MTRRRAQDDSWEQRHAGPVAPDERTVHRSNALVDAAADPDEVTVRRVGTPLADAAHDDVPPDAA